MKIDTFQEMRSVEGGYIRIDLRGFDTTVTEVLAHKLQRTTVQKQMHRKAVPKGMASDLERRLSPHLVNQSVDVGTDRLARDRKYSLVLPKLSHPQVALNPGLKVSI